MRGKVEMEPCDWLLAKEEVSRLRGDWGGVMRLGLLHSEWEREPGTNDGGRERERKRGKAGERERGRGSVRECSLAALNRGTQDVLRVKQGGGTR